MLKNISYFTHSEKKMAKYAGVLHGFFETGTEGVVWSLEKNGHTGYEALVFLEAGDYLVVYDEDGSVLFNGVIVPDYKAGWQEYPLNPGHGQPAALGFWVHWTQRGWTPDDWAELFLHRHLKAELTKKND